MLKRLIYRVFGLLPVSIQRLFPIEKLFKFLVVGGIGSAFGMGLLYALTEWAGLHYLVSLSIVYLPMSYLVYMGNCGWTFKNFLGIRGFLKFLLARGVTTVIGFGLVTLLTSVLGIWYMLSPIIGGGLMSIVNFVVSHNWIWKHTKSS